MQPCFITATTYASAMTASIWLVSEGGDIIYGASSTHWNDGRADGSARCPRM